MLEKEEGELLDKEQGLLEAVRAAGERVNQNSTGRTTAALLVKTKQTARGVAGGERVVLEKKLAGEELLLEKQRSQLHEVLQRAQVDEIALPTVDLVNVQSSGVGKSGSKGGNKGGGKGGRRGRNEEGEERKDDGDGDGEGEGEVESGSGTMDVDLLWTGSQTSHRSGAGSGPGKSGSRRRG